MKMSDYSERVLKPRQSSLLQQRTKRHYSMAGETWRLTQGFPVGVSKLKLIITTVTCSRTQNVLFCLFFLQLKISQVTFIYLYYKSLTSSLIHCSLYSQ